MAIFVFCANLAVAGFIFTTAVEIFSLLIGSILWTMGR